MIETLLEFKTNPNTRKPAKILSLISIYYSGSTNSDLIIFFIRLKNMPLSYVQLINSLYIILIEQTKHKQQNITVTSSRTMYHFMNKKLEKQQPVEDIVSVRPQVFNFSFSHPCENQRQLSDRDRINSIRYKDSFPSSFHCLREDFVWKPKLPCKKIFDDPKFLLSLERKKVRVINGLRGCEFQANEVHRTQLKNLKKKNKKQTIPRQKIFSQPQKISQNYVHASLNLQASQTHRIAKTPYLNFNLHHLIRQRKQANTDHHHQQQHEPKQIPKAGSNLPYYALFKSERFDRSLRSYEIGQQNTDNIPPRGQIRTALTRQKNRFKYRCKNNKSTAQQKRVFAGGDEQPADS